VKNWKLSYVIATAVLVSACAADGENKPIWEGITSTIGGIAGGALGSQIGGGSGRYAAGAIGAVVGAEFGRRLGKYLDKADQEKAQQQIQVQLQQDKPQTTVACAKDNTRGFGVVPTGGAASVNCGDKNKIVVSTGSTFTGMNGQDCKEYKTEVMTPQGQTETVPAKACKGADGQFHDVA